MTSIVVRNLRWMSMSNSITAACTATSSVEQAHRGLRRAGKGAGDADALLVLAALPARAIAAPDASRLGHHGGSHPVTMAG